MRAGNVIHVKLSRDAVCCCVVSTLDISDAHGVESSCLILMRRRPGVCVSLGPHIGWAGQDLFCSART